MLLIQVSLLMSKGWTEIRETDRGLLWEHLVLDMLHVAYGNVYYWTDKYRNEIDFIVKGQGNELHTIRMQNKSG